MKKNKSMVVRWKTIPVLLTICILFVLIGCQNFEEESQHTQDQSMKAIKNRQMNENSLKNSSETNLNPDTSISPETEKSPEDEINPETEKSPTRLVEGNTIQDLGVNLDGVTDWAAGLMFVDAMKASRQWGNCGAAWETDQVTVDQAGWPTSDAGVIVYADIYDTDISGTYSLSFEGKADIKPYSNTSVMNVTYSGGITRAQIVVPYGETSLMIDFVNTQGGVRNVKLIRPGYENKMDQIFTDEFLKALEPFSTLRFMDPLETNTQNFSSNEPWYTMETLEWEDRKLTSDASQASFNQVRGISWEYVAELANLTGKDCWINIPINASDDYVKQLFLFMKDQLDEDIHLYVEYSNEVWNWGFPQSNFNLQKAKENAIVLNYVAVNNISGSEYLLEYADHTIKIAKIAEEVFGSASINQKVRIILAWQFGWNPPDWQPREMLDYITATYGQPSNYLYALGIAPYFSEPLPENCVDVQSILAYMKESSDSSVEAKKLLLNLVQKYKLPGGLCCYEGGPSHQGQLDVNLNTRIQAHLSEGIQETIIRDLTTNWWDLGGGLFMYYKLSSSNSVYGCWGLVQSFDNINTEKYNAVVSLWR